MHESVAQNLPASDRGPEDRPPQTCQVIQQIFYANHIYPAPSVPECGYTKTESRKWIECFQGLVTEQKLSNLLINTTKVSKTCRVS
jgi:hypothetical protein